MLDFRQVLTGAWIRAVANIQDAGEVLMGFVSDPDGGNPVSVDPNNQDIYVKVIDTVSNLPVIGRLFSPGNGFWRLPKTNDGVVILRGREAHGPGAPVILHGDGGYNNAVPSWLGTSDAGVSIPETLHLESTQGAVAIKSNTSGATIATISANADGSITITGAANSNVNVSTSGTGSVSVSASPVTGAVKLGPVASLQVLVQGTTDAIFGAPVLQAPAATLSIVKAG